MTATRNQRKFAWFANAIVLGSALSVLALMVRSNYSYADGIQGIGDFVYYWLVPLGAILLLLSTLRLEVDTRSNVALAICSVAATLLLAEIVLRMLDGHELSSHAVEARRLGVRFDERSSVEVIRDLSERGPERAWPSVAPAFLLDEGFRVRPGANTRLLPLAGISGVPTVYCNETGEWVVYRSDEFGFHNPPGQHIEGVEIAIVGDSFAQGGCVDSGENVAAILRHSSGSAVNLGMGGSGPLLEYAILLEYAVPLRPKTVLWFYFEGNDLQDQEAERGMADLVEIYERGTPQGLRVRQAEIDAALTELVEAREARIRERSSWAKIFVLNGLRKRLKRLLIPRPAETQFATPDPGRLVEILSRGRDLTEGFGSSFHVVYLPAWIRYAGQGAEASFRRTDVLRLMSDAGLSVIDVHASFAQLDDPTKLFALGIDGHYNAAGYRLAAQAILESLEGSDLPGRKVAIE